MEMQSKLNEMLRKKLHKAMEEEICDCQMMDEVDRKEALHRILLFQEIVSYFDENQVSSKEAAVLLDNDYLLEDLYEEWCDRYDEKCAALFEAFLETEISIAEANGNDKGV